MAAAAHHIYEASLTEDQRKDEADNWPEWYANYIAKELL